MTELDQFWPACLARLEAELSAQQFNTWIKPLSAELADEGVLLYAPNRFIMQFIKERFLGRIEELAAELVGQMPVELRIGSASGAPAAPASRPAPRMAPPETAQTVHNDALSQAKQAAVKAIGAGHESTRLNPGFTFETLVTGKGNQLARAAALQIAENPGDPAYNPLFVYGGVGLGKTHLIQAIGNHVYQKNPAARIRYSHAERYVADIMRAYQHKAFDEFKRYYHSLDLLLIDDIQFFAGKIGRAHV